MPDPASSVRERAPASEYEHALMDLAAVLAHRLRGLVAGIEGFVDLLTETLGTREQRELALRIFEGAARIEHILADLQLYSQPVEAVMIPLRLGDVMEELGAAVDEDSRDRLHLALKLSADRLLMADPRLLKQALIVLVQNALDASKQGAVQIQAGEEPDGRQIVFDVWNEGAVPLRDAETQVFRPFFTTKAQNLGIGLAIARRIVEAHGGMLYLATNDPVEGTCFRLRLPVSVPGDAATGDAAAPDR